MWPRAPSGSALSMTTLREKLATSLRMSPEPKWALASGVSATAGSATSDLRRCSAVGTFGMLLLVGIST